MFDPEKGCQTASPVWVWGQRQRKGWTGGRTRRRRKRGKLGSWAMASSSVSKCYVLCPYTTITFHHPKPPSLPSPYHPHLLHPGMVCKLLPFSCFPLPLPLKHICSSGLCAQTSLMKNKDSLTRGGGGGTLF